MNQKQIKMVTISLMLADVMAGLDSTITNTAMPAIISALHGIQFMGWIVAMFMLGMSISIPLWTKIGEKITNKKAFEISLLFFIAGSILQGMAPNILFFLASRFLMGIGAGGMGSLPYIIAGYVFKNLNQRTKILAYLTASFNAAAILGPLVGGWLVDSLSWRWVFYLNIPIGLVALTISIIYFKPVTPKKTPVFDLVGSGLLTAGLLTFLLGIQLIGIASGRIVTLLIIVSLVLLAGFFEYERRAANPIIPLSLFKKRNLNGDFLLFALTWGAFIAVNTYLPMWAQALLGMSALLGGMTMIPNSITNIVSSQFVAPLQEHVRTFTLMLIGILCMIFSSGAMYLADLHTPIIWLSLACAMSGIGVGFIFVALQLKVQVDAGLQNMATATSTSYLIRILAQTVMSAVYGVIMNLALARGVAQHPAISMKMMNELSDAQTAKLLPQHLLPTMRQIFYQGIKEIMLVSLILLAISLVMNHYFNFRKDRD
jgi:MFS family permease